MLVLRLFITLMLVFSASLVHSEPEVDPIATLTSLQQTLIEDQKAVASSQGQERLYFEDVLQRKGKQFQQQLTLLVQQQKGDIPPALVELVNTQIRFLVKARKISEDEVNRLMAEAEQTTGEEMTKQYEMAYENMAIVDIYILAYADTLNFANKLNINTEAQLEEFKQSLTQRADLLANMLRFFNKRFTDAKSKLALASEQEKSVLNQEIAQLEESSKSLVTSLENTVSVMDRYQLETTEYKKLIFSLTGAITVDVLDLSVVSGLANEWLGNFKDWAITHTPTLIMRILLFIIIMFITRSVARLVKRAIKRSVSHSNMNFSILMQEFFVNLSGKVVIILGLLIAISQLGIDLGPLLAGFGVAGIVIGLALQDTLSNFASGMMILIYRPFDVGDFVEVAGGVRGKVSHMSLVSTTIKTIDHQRLIIPNNKIWGDTINNISGEEFRRVDMIFGIGYGDDIKKTERVLKEILDSHPAILTDEEHKYMIKVHALGESSVDFAVRPWVKNADYWDVYWDVTRAVKLRFDEEGISIPFPQRDVHIYQHNQAQKEADVG